MISPCTVIPLSVTWNVDGTSLVKKLILVCSSVPVNTLPSQKIVGRLSSFSEDLASLLS